MADVKTTFGGLHIVRYGTAADQKFLVGDFLETYDQLVINAKMVAHMPAALASFLTQRTKNKPYFIDPQTHAFQHDLSFLESSSEHSQGELKRSIKTLLAAYGDPVDSQVRRKSEPVLPQNLHNGRVRAGFCERVLNFQASALADEATQTDSAKYYNFLRQQDPDRAVDPFGPTILVAPYFFMSRNTFDDWLQVNIDCAMDSITYARSRKAKIAVQVVCDRDVLGLRAMRETMEKAYAALSPDVFLIWIDQFSDQDASEQELSSFIALLNALGNSAPTVNLYGGYFSVALVHCNIVPTLCGVAHGLEYGEDRGVVPVGGGIPTAKFYIPPFHSRFLFRDSLRVIRAMGGFASSAAFFKKVCSCKECMAIIRNNPKEEFAEYGRTRPVSFIRRNQPIVSEFPLPETREHSVRHYMWGKDQEYRVPIPTDDLLTQLDRGQSILAKTLGLERAAYCKTWRKVLSDHTKKK